jgi:cell division septum initiation protein DivIVA
MFDEESFCQALERNLSELRRERMRQAFLAKVVTFDETRRRELEDSVAQFQAESAQFQEQWRTSLTLFSSLGMDAKPV